MSSAPWEESALCSGMDTDLWYPTRSDPGLEGKAICHACPASVACLNHAMAAGERYGTWGGLGPRQRARLARLAAEP